MKITCRIRDKKGDVIGFTTLTNSGLVKNISFASARDLILCGTITNAVYVSGKTGNYIRAKRGKFKDKVSYALLKPFIIKEDYTSIISTTSKGNQIKWKMGGYWWKIDKHGYEGLAEELASLVLSHIKGIDYTFYNSCVINSGGDLHFGCISKDFLSAGEQHITFANKLFSWQHEDIIKKRFGYLSTMERAEFTIRAIENLTGLNTLQYVADCIFLDSIILNEDRHLSNLGLIEDSKHNWRTVPIYDNGLSLLSDLSAYDIDSGSLYKLTHRVKSKPFNRNFKKQVIALRELGGKPLNIDIDKLVKDINGYTNMLYDCKFVKRALEVLLIRLKEMEGLAWERG